MDSWNKLICQGNRRFERGQLDDASWQYLAALRNSRRAQDAVLSFVEEHGIAGSSCAFERSITHLPPSPAPH